MKPTDKIKPEIKPEPEQFDNNTPRTKEEWFKSKWKMEKYTHNINGHGITFCIFFFWKKISNVRIHSKDEFLYI